MANKEKKTEKKSGNTLIKDTIALTVITLIAGILLGGVYTMTKKPIEEQNETKKAEAYAAVFEGAKFVPDDVINEKLTAYNEELAAGKVVKANETLSDVVISEIMKAQVDGADAGYVVTCAAKGYGGNVTIALGINAEGDIQGIQITDASNETPGLGQNSTDPNWNSRFIGMNISQEVAIVKDGSESVENGSVDAISGATITSRAVSRAVNGTLSFIASLSE